MKNKIQYVGYLITAACLWYVISSIQWEEARQAFAKVSVLDLIILTALYFTGFIVRAFRSQFMLPQPGLMKSGASVIIGYAANNVLPARLGEFVRAEVVGKLAGIKRSVALATIAVERLFDGVSMVILLFIGASQLSLPEWVDNLRIFGVLLFGGGLLVTLLVGANSKFISPFIPNNKIGDIFRGLLEGLVIATRSIPVTVSLILLSVLVWTVESSMFLYAFRIFHFDLGISAAFLTMAVINLGLLVPSSPGFIGVFQTLTILVLGLFAIPNSDALAYSVIVHLCQYLPLTVVGIFLLHTLGLHSFRELTQNEKGTETT